MGVGGFDGILLWFYGVVGGCVTEVIIGMSYKHELNNTLFKVCVELEY